MNLSQFFGDDEHTASDGIYLRMLKTRKWLYLASIAGALHSADMINYGAITDITAKLLSVASAEAWVGLFLGLVTLTVQYTFLGVQLGIAYPSLSRERFSQRTADAFHKLDAERAAAINQISDRRRTLEDDEREGAKQRVMLALLEHDLPEVEKLREDSSLSDMLDAEGEKLNRASPQERQLLKKQAQDRLAAQQSIMRMRHGELQSSELALRQSEEKYALLLNNTPERNRLFRWSEYALDVLRFGPPFVVALLSLLFLAVNRPFWTG